MLDNGYVSKCASTSQTVGDERRFLGWIQARVCTDLLRNLSYRWIQWMKVWLWGEIYWKYRCRWHPQKLGPEVGHVVREIRGLPSDVVGRLFDQEFERRVLRVVAVGAKKKSKKMKSPHGKRKVRNDEPAK
jgi:hypothetical protein